MFRVLARAHLGHFADGKLQCREDDLLADGVAVLGRRPRPLASSCSMRVLATQVLANRAQRQAPPGRILLAVEQQLVENSVSSAETSQVVPPEKLLFGLEALQHAFLLFGLENNENVR